jgi:CubicO group peptidase (beta-lactamase class C family)
LDEPLEEKTHHQQQHNEQEQQQQQEQEFDCDGIWIPPKYSRQRGKMALNQDYVTYMKGRQALSLSPTCTKLDAVTGLVDLSKDFAPAGDQRALRTNPGAKWIDCVFGNTKEVRRVTVIENGKLVADFRKDGVGLDDTFNLFSTTKGVVSMLIGVVVDRTDLALDHTLEEIFRDNPTAWSRLANSPEELAYTKSVTLQEIMTMTSGLTSVLGGVRGIMSMKELSVADAPGSDLARALAAPGYNPKNRGTFHYMPSSNILSYVIHEKTGMSPLQFATKHVFPKLGIHPSRMKWESNAEGIETSYSQLYLTTHQMCKVGQLFLQDGYPSPKSFKPLFGQDWVEASHAKHVFGNSGFDHWYGLLWSLYDRDYHGNQQAGDIWCAPGFNGQLIAMSRETNRVVAISRTPIPMDAETLVNYKKSVIKLLGKTMSYTNLPNESSNGNDNANDKTETRNNESCVGVPKKYIRDSTTRKMIVNPDYVEFMTDLQQKKKSDELKMKMELKVEQELGPPPTPTEEAIDRTYSR